MSQHNKLDNPQTSSEKSQPRASIMLSPRKENPVNTTENPNLIALSTESANKTMDLNQRLKSFEQSIKSLQNQVDTSHQKFHHSILDLSSKTQVSKEELYKSQHNVQGLESSYKMLNAQASELSTKTSTISQALEELTKLREQSEQNLDNKLIENNNQVSLELQQITKNVEQLDTLFVRLEKQVELLLSSSNSLTQSIQQQVSEQNTSMLKIKSEFDKKTLILSNDLKHLDSKHSQSLDNINSLSNEKENHLREEFKQQIKTLESKQENEVELLLAQQKELDAKSQEILNQTNSQVKQHTKLLKQQQANLSQNNEVLEQHQSQHKLHHSEISKHTNTLNHHQHELDKQSTKLETQHIELDKHESQLQQFKIQLKQADAGLKQTTSELDKKVQDNKELHHQEVKVLANHVSKHNEAIETKLIELNQETISLQQETASQSTEINNLKQDAVNLRKKTTINHDHFIEVNNDLEELDLLFQKQTQQTAIQIDNISSLQVDHSHKLSTLETSSEELFAHTDELQTKTDNLTIQALQAKESIELLDKKQHNTLTDLIKTNSKVINISTKTDELEKGIAQVIDNEAKHFSLIQYASFIVAIIFISSTIYLTNAIQTEEQKTNDHFVQQSQTMSQQQKNQELLQQQYKRHDSALLNAKQVQYNMNKEINQLKNELKAVKQENVSLQAQQDNVSQQLNQVKGNLQLVDDNVDYLNHSVGPLVEYQHGKLNGPNWIVLQHPENLTILISKHKSKNELFKFLEEESYFLRGDLAFYTLNEGNQTYYILTYGSFENIKTAKQSANELPYLLGNQQQLIIPFKDIQPSILVSH